MKRKNIGLFGLSAVLAIALASPAWAAPNPSIVGRAGGIEYGQKDAGGLVISSIKLDTTLTKATATVMVEVTIYNPERSNDDDRGNGGQQMEADFQWALPAGAVVTGYALDIDGRMVDGVLLDQPRAKKIYQDEIRKGIDPGLAEQSADNVFKTRIFPILPGKSRTIRLHFVTPFDPASGLKLPLNEVQAGNASVAVRMAGDGTAPVVTLPMVGKMKFERKGDYWIGEVVQGGPVALNGAIGIRADQGKGTMTVAQHGNGKRFFEIVDTAPMGSKPLATGRPVRIYWDRSLSRKSAALDREIAFLDKFFVSAAPSAIEIIWFAEGTPEVRQFGDAASALAALKATHYRGGTSFKGLDKLSGKPAACLMFSDGLAIVDQMAAFRPSCPLDIINSGASADETRLGRLAEASGGRLIRLQEGAEDAALQRLVTREARVMDVQDGAGQSIDYRLLPSAGGFWSLVGPMPGGGMVKLVTAQSNGEIVERDYRVALGTVTTNAPGSLWAAERANMLADNPAKREELSKLAHDYSITAPGMAYLVLERPDQYADNEIEPPAGFPDDWMAEYRELKSSRAEERQEELADWDEERADRWEDRVAWRKEKFDPNAKARSGSVRGQRGNVEAVAVLAEPPPPVVVMPSPVATPPAGSPPPPPPSLPSALARMTDRDAAANVAVDEAEESANFREIMVAGTAAQPGQGTYAGDVAQPLDEHVTVNDGETETTLDDILSGKPWIAELKKAPDANRRDTLAKLEGQYGTLAVFWLDTADWYARREDRALAREMLLSALELPTADDETRTIVAFRLEREGDVDTAIALLERIVATTPDRPQPKRQLALALIKRGKAAGEKGVDDLERAFTLLMEAAAAPPNYGNDYDGIDEIALVEANALIPLLDGLDGAYKIDPKLRQSMDADIRIVVEWTNDDADLDLHVIEPNGEEVFYAHQRSAMGGRISNDMTDGFGPEEYVLTKAPSGEFKVLMHGYSSDRLNPNGEGRVLIRLYRNFGRANQSEEMMDVDIGFNRRSENNNVPVATMRMGK